MKPIGGNLTTQLQLKTGSVKNEIGEKVPQWTTVHNLTGFLDLANGDSKYSSYDAKIQESTHIFVCDYVQIDERITAENSRMIIKSRMYDVMLIDDPMELNKHLEIYLKYTGGQNGA